MVKALLGKKLGMTQVYGEDGTLVPVTVLGVGPCPVVQVKRDVEGLCRAVQIGFDERKCKHTTKPMQGHFAKAGVSPLKILRDVAPEPDAEIEPGQVLTVDVFEGVALVDVTGTSKGRGFAGVMKRHGFRGGPASHGATTHRHGGSIGPGSSPGRVMKGRKMPGHMGDSQVTVRSLKVVKVDGERDLLLVRGAVPGSRGGWVLVRKAIALNA
ncbi:MAG: 50S ribosomal protein L3 [Candidatus Brocadiia bacterium]|nr:50S ribosomal protein L3 [Candidatus Brocadiia bacterium]